VPTNDSKTLPIVGVNDTGLISCLNDFGCFIFGITTKFAVFQIVGTTPSAIDDLKIQTSGCSKQMQSHARTNLSVWSCRFANIGALQFAKTVSVVMF